MNNGYKVYASQDWVETKLKDLNITVDPAGESLGLVKTGGDVTITDGVITVNSELLSTKQDKNLIVNYKENSVTEVTHGVDEIAEAASKGIDVKFFDGYEYLDLLEYSEGQGFAVFYVEYFDMNEVFTVKYIVTSSNGSIMMADKKEYNLAYKSDLNGKQDKLIGTAGQFVQFDSNGKPVGVNLDLSAYETKEDAQSKYDTITSAKADWNQNDENAIDYVKNRTHWVEEELKTIVSEQVVSSGSDVDTTDIDITWFGDKVVIVDGVEYRSPYWQNMNGDFCWGDSRLSSMTDDHDLHHENVPYLFYCWWDIPVGSREQVPYLNFTFADGESHTVEIKESTGNIAYHTLDEKFIPESIARTSYVNEAVSAVKNELLNGAGEAYDTLKELGDLIDDNHDAIDALGTIADSKADANHLHNYYGVCETTAGTAAKTVTIDGFQLVEGAIVVVKFINSNSASNPTLNVSGTGALPMYRYGTTALSTGTTTTGWYAGSVQVFVYDGNGWIRDYWNNSTYSNAGLGNGYGTCSTAASTLAKTATLSNYTLSTGGAVSIRFDNDVPANATLNIASKGAKAIYYRGAAIVNGVIKAGDVATFVYNGTYYHLIAIDNWQQNMDTLRAEIQNLELITVDDIDAICGGSIQYAEEVLF